MKKNIQTERSGISKNNWPIRELGMLLAIGLALAWTENLFPRILIWQKIGLAQLATLMALYFYGVPAALYIGLMRPCVASLFQGTLATPIFLLSIGGSLCSLVAMIPLFYLRPKYMSLIGVSISGALASSSMQIVLAYVFLIPEKSIFSLMPIIWLTALASGLAMGYLAEVSIPYFSLLFNRDSKSPEEGLRGI